MRKLLVLLAVLLAGCGGGGGDGEDGSDGIYYIDSLSFDEYNRPIEVYQPPANAVSFFPLALHWRTITKSYVSKIGTTAVREYVISGTMTTPTVNQGAYEAKLTQTLSYQSTRLFEGVSVVPVKYDSRQYQIKLNSSPQTDEITTSTGYFDSTYGLRVGSSSQTTYKVVDINASQSLPETAFSGDKGDFLTYNVYSNSAKTSLIGKEVLSYNVVSASLGTSGEYKATVESILKSYSPQGQLLSVQTTTDELVYSITSGAAAKNISIYVDDISGTTTSRLKFTRVK
jgi:hypothetical protein